MIPNRGNYTNQACLERAEWINQRISAPLKYSLFGNYKTNNLVGNIENPFGLAKIPVAVLPPLEIYNFDQPVICPFATTEGCLVASISRGIRVLNMSNLKTYIRSKKVYRCPV